MSAPRPPELSIIIPALDAAGSLPATLAALAASRGGAVVQEIIVVDGGSRDTTADVAREGGARVVTAPPGRGAQLVAGAATARGTHQGGWLLFLHADTVLGAGWREAARDFMKGSGNETRAAVFRFALDEADPRARRVERLARWRGRALGLPYGDQGLLISRAFYDRLGGFRPLPLMEDVELVRRIGRANLVELDAAAVTSAARYRSGGWWLRPLRNLSILTLYFLGVSPRALKRLYG